MKMNMKINLKLTAPIRGLDAYGSGAYHASRGNRLHQGIDILATAKSKVHAILEGTVTKLGYPYANDLSFRYVEVTNSDGYKLRYFYTEPLITVGTKVNPDDIIGYVQNLDPRYKGIPNHVHFEIKNPEGNYINPEEYLETL